MGRSSLQGPYRLLDRASWVLDTVRDNAWVLRRLEIASNDLVLDVGSGAAPNWRANVLCDKFVYDATERHGLAIRRDRPFIVGDVEHLPFQDKAFDFVICSHLLEHVTDPGAAVAELQRVAHRGYIETPSPNFEKAHGFPFHRWMISARDNTLIFERKRAPLYDEELRRWFISLLNELGIEKRFWFARRRLGVYTSFCWEGSISCEVMNGTEEDEGFQHSELGTSVSEPETTTPPPGIASRAIARYGQYLRRRSDPSWDEVEQRLRCPLCAGTLERGTATYRCAECGRDYPDMAGSPCLLPVEQG